MRAEHKLTNKLGAFVLDKPHNFSIIINLKVNLGYLGDFTFGARTLSIMAFSLIRLYHPLDGIANPKHKLMRFLTNKIFLTKRRSH